MEKKKLYRSEKDKFFGGLLAGLGEYMGIDSSILRLAYLFITVFTGFFPGIVVYLIALAIVPQNPE